MDRRIINTRIQNEEEIKDNNIRPQTIEDYIGQSKIKDTVKIYIEAAKKRGEGLDHTLFYGPPGLGKTTLAMIIAREMGVNIKVTSGPAIEKPGNLIAILKKLKKNDILFIDEIHRLNKQVEESLYPVMEDFSLDITYDNDSIRINLPHFTLIGATTRAGMLSAPLRDRFGVVGHMEYYTVDELNTIINNSASKLDIEIESDAAYNIAKRSRGTPRIANRMLKRVRDFAQVKGDGIITNDIANIALETLGIDANGLDDIDRRIIMTILRNYKGGPVGIDAIASSIGEERETIEDVYEPYLVQEGYIIRGPRGRQITDKVYTTMNIFEN